MKSKILFLAIAFLFIGSLSRAQNKLLSISNNLDSATENIPWINQLSSVRGNAFSGQYYSSTDSLRPYGLGYKGPFPQICINKNLKISFSEYIRAKTSGTDVSMVVTVSLGDSVVIWNSKNISVRLNPGENWTKISDEVDVPSVFTGKEYTLAIYLWNKDGITHVDMDDFKIDFEEKFVLSFLPSGFIRNNLMQGYQKLFSNKFHSFYYNKDDGAVEVLNSDGDTVINSIAIRNEWYDEDKKEERQFWNSHLYFRKDSITEEGNYLKFSAHDELTETEITILAGSQGSLNFMISTRFLKHATVRRHSLLTGFGIPFTSVFKKNTLTDTTDLKKEYWLDKEGFIISGDKNSMIVYHPEKISSIQLDVKNNTAIFNLDYSGDHPMLHFPLLKESQNKFIDYSTSVFKKDDLITGEFTFYRVKKNFKMATLLSNPNGYLASFVWTEHADYTNLRTHRAVYFGNENINELDKASGGFLKYSIPVTKSVFYANPDKVDNADKAGFMPGPVATIKETAGFKDFLRQLYEYGMEVCLHTPDHFTSTRKLLAEALDYTKKDFSPVTWIDHGYDNLLKSNREDLSCDGADSTSDYYAADLWRKYGIKYFWNSFYEDSNIFNAYSFNSFFSVPYSGWSDGMPTPVFWKNNTRTGELVHWRTTNTMDPTDGSLWGYYFNDLRLSDVVKNRDNIIIHCYPARVDSTNGFYTIQNGVVSANEEFNKALKKLSDYRSMGKIRLTTIRELLDYSLALEDLSFEFLQDGTIQLINSGKSILRGVSFSANASEVSAESKEIQKWKNGNELIFWMDVLPGEKIKILLK